MMTTFYNNIKRDAFTEVADLCKYNSEVKNPFYSTVKVYYNGSNLRGDMRVEVADGESKIYKMMLKKVAEILIKYE